MRVKTTVRLFAVLALVGLGAEAASAAPKPRLGVFGTVHGKKFKATSRDGVGDACVHGIYNQNGPVITFYAIECRKHRRRQGATKRNYKLLLIGCSKYDQNVDTSVTPFELPCPTSAYTEAKTGRFGIPKSMTEWGASFDLDPNTFLVSSSVRVRVDAIDGANVRGAILGVFTEPLAGEGSATPASISGEVTFEFPFELR